MKHRLYAFLIHLSLSCTVSSLTVILVFYYWYPAPLNVGIGATNIFLMLLAINITIGPLLTVLVYKPSKPSLKFDLSFIALCQLVALSYGMTMMFEGRPAFVVFSVDRFDVVRALDIDTNSAKKALNSGNVSATVSWFKPHWVGALNSPDLKRRNEITFSSTHGGPDWPQLPELFVPLEQLKQLILSKSKSLIKLKSLTAEEYELLLKEHGDTIKWLPLHSRKKDMTVLINGTTASVIKVIEVDPW